MEDRIIEKIVRSNLEMLFSPSDFSIKIEHPTDDEKIRIIMITPSGKDTTSMTTKMEINEVNKKNKKISIGTSFYTESVNDEFSDLVTCCKAIERRLDQLSWVKNIYYETDEFVVVGFTEIGISKADGKRDLLVSRGKLYSLVTFSKGTAVTKPLTEKDVAETLTNAISSGCDIDFCGSDIIYFVDLAEYEGDDD
ncbi:MAG: hypothetical protein J5614_02095 [Paludibacteraceae bacterium]|nr:hypothetical protein [Paludibacteraceae bacterium]